MHRLQLRRPAVLRRRPFRARRLTAVVHVPMEYSTPRPAPRWLIVGAGVLGLLVMAMLLVGVAVIA